MGDFFKNDLDDYASGPPFESWQESVRRMAAEPLPVGWVRNGATNCLHETGAMVWYWPSVGWMHQAYFPRSLIEPDGHCGTRDEAMKEALDGCRSFRT